MVELETLKDLPIYILNNQGCLIGYVNDNQNIPEKDIAVKAVDYLKLKQEAIKWIKELKIKCSYCELIYKECIVLIDGIGICPKEYTIEWIKNLFNITDDDLK